MISLIQHKIEQLFTKALADISSVEEKAKARIVIQSLFQGIIGTFLAICLVLDAPLYVAIYIIYTCLLCFCLFLMYKGKFAWVQFNFYYISLVYLFALSILSQGKLLIDYFIVASIIVTYADFQAKKARLTPLIVGLVFFTAAQIINHYDIINYPLPKNKEIMYYLHLMIAITLIWNAMIELRKEVYKYKGDIESKNEELIEANVLKNKLFSIIGHDLRQPFNSIQGLMELLESDALDDGTRVRIVKRIRVSNKNALSTLENLLHWGISMQKQEKPLQKNMQVLEVVNSVFEVLSETAENKKICLENRIDISAKVWVNPDHFDLVLRNLVANAIKFSYSQGKILIDGQHHLENEVFEIVIKDSGIGMSKTQVEKLFDKTHINSTKGTAKEKGTGLGLMLCKEFIEQNQGKIEVISEEGKGTSVSIYLKT